MRQPVLRMERRTSRGAGDDTVLHADIYLVCTAQLRTRATLSMATMPPKSLGSGGGGGEENKPILYAVSLAGAFWWRDVDHRS
jgi:hypothetical protein